MITAVNEKTYEYRGLASDFELIKEDASFNSKVGNGSIFLCIDTFAVHIYDEENSTWLTV